MRTFLPDVYCFFPRTASNSAQDTNVFNKAKQRTRPSMFSLFAQLQLGSSHKRVLALLRLARRKVKDVVTKTLLPGVKTMILGGEQLESGLAPLPDSSNKGTSS